MDNEVKSKPKDLDLTFFYVRKYFDICSICYKIIFRIVDDDDFYPLYVKTGKGRENLEYLNSFLDKRKAYDLKWFLTRIFEELTLILKSAGKLDHEVKTCNFKVMRDCEDKQEVYDFINSTIQDFYDNFTQLQLCLYGVMNEYIKDDGSEEYRELDYAKLKLQIECMSKI